MHRRDIVKLVGKVGLVAAAQLVPWKLLQSTGLLDECTAEASYNLRAGSVIGNSLIASLGSHAKNGGADATWTLENETGAAFLRPAGQANVLRLACTDPGTGTPGYYVQWNINEPLSAIHSFSIPYFIHGGQTVANLQLLVAQEAGFTNYYTWSALNNPNTIRPGWNVFHFARPADTTNGTPNDANNFARIRLTTTLTAGTTRTVYIGPLYKNQYSVPTVAIVLDDGDATAYTVAFPYMQARGMVGSLAPHGTQTGLTVAQMREMYDAGWSFHNHGAEHLHWPELSASALLTEFTGGRKYLTQYGFTRGVDDVVYPFGEFNETVQTLLQQQGVRSAWATHGRAESTWQDRLTEPYGSYRFSMDSGTSTLAQVKTRIDNIRKTGMACVIYGHRIAEGAGAGETELATFKGVIDYLYVLQARVVTLSALVDGLSKENPRRQRI